MINWLKILRKDFGNLSKPQFLQKYFIPGFAIFCTWGIAGNLMLINLDTSSLIKTRGEVIGIDVKAEKGAKSTSYPLKIRIMRYSRKSSDYLKPMRKTFLHYKKK